MKNKRSSLGLLLIGLCSFPLLEWRSHAAVYLLPFQGRLSDANGQAVSDGARVVQFKIYDAPVGGRAVWNGEVQKLSVNSGLVSTILGTKSDLSRVDFNRQIYLELTIDADGDSLITAADPPLLPRQSILPSVFSVESANSRLLAGYDWSALFGTNNPADGALIDSKIADGSLNTIKLHDAAVTSTKISNGAVTRPKLDVTGATVGQALTYNGSEVVWSQVNAANATTADSATDAAHLNGFDWTSLFNNGNPQSGTMSVANLTSRSSANVFGDLTVSGRALFNGSATTVQGLLVAPSIGINMFLNDWGLYMRGVGDFNHFLKYGNVLGSQSGFDGPMLVGLAGGVLGTVGNWSLRWNSSGTVQVRGTVTANGVVLSSDRNLKENFAHLDAREVLDKVLALPVTTWNFKTESVGVKHIGPMAQDFQAAFQLSADDHHISIGDEGGVALAAIQGLNKKVDQRNSELLELVKQQQEQIEALKAQIAAMKARKE